MIDTLAIVILRELCAGERLEASEEGSGAVRVEELAQGSMHLLHTLPGPQAPVPTPA